MKHTLGSKIQILKRLKIKGWANTSCKQQAPESQSGHTNIRQNKL